MNLYTSLIFILTSAVLCVRINSREKSWFKLNTTISNRASGDSRFDWATKRRTKPDLTWTFCCSILKDNCVCLIRRLFYLPDCFVRWLRASSSLGEERSSFCFLKNILKEGGETPSPSPYRIEGFMNNNLHKKWIRVLCSATKSSFLKNMFLWNRIFSAYRVLEGEENIKAYKKQ